MNWIGSNLDVIWALTVEHLGLSVVPVILGFVIAIPIGWLAWRLRWSRGVLLGLVGVIYAIPSLPLLVTLPALIGVPLRSPVNLMAALTLYAVAVMVRAAADAFGDVDRDVLLAADAIGFGRLRRFFAVELPLAGPGLLAGLRVVIVSTVSLVTISALIGVESLGSLFTDGFQRDIPAEVWAGVLGTVVVAAVLDLASVGLGRLLLPWAESRRPRRRAMRMARLEARA